MECSFFDFESCGYLTTFAARAEGYLNDKDIDLKLPFGKYDGYGFPIVFRQNKEETGKRMRDFLDTRCPSFYLISERTINLLKDNKITGWRTYPIELYDKKGNQINGYSGFSVVGSGGSLGNLEQRRKDSISHMQFFINQWDGSDFFSFEDTLFIITTQNVKDLFKKNKIDAVEFSPITDCGIDLIL